MQSSVFQVALRGALGLFLACAGVVAQEDPYLEDLRTAERHASKGKRARAASIFEEILDDADEFGVGGDGPSARVVRAARLGLLELELIAGNYEDVVASVGRLDKGTRESADVQWLLSRAHQRTGAYDKARKILASLAERESASLRYACALGELLEESGDRAGAKRLWQSVVDQSRRSANRDADALTWIARAHIRLGTRADYEQASALLVDAIRKEPEHADARIQFGWLRYLAYGEAAGFETGETVIKKVLDQHGEREDALITLYRIRSQNAALDSGKTMELLDRALGVNPNSVDVRLYRGIRLLDDRRFREGAEMLESALDINPNDKRVLAQCAAAAHLRGRKERAKEFRTRALEVDPQYVGLDLALGDRLSALYRFADAIEPYERAFEQEPTSLDVLHGFAKACVYTGQGERARTLLRQAADQQKGLIHPWRNNVLASEELLAEEYDRIETEGFVFKIHRDDRAVLEEYLVPFHQEARVVLGEKYGHVPADPVTVEVLHTWDDFSVRTTGYRGFTALGACFGGLVTLVSPSDGDLRKNDFMWTATVWHEYAHVLTLALSKARVPRWLTEGFSVYEERAKNPTWERGMLRDLLDAYHNQQIAPVHLLNRLFRGPRILFGYYQGGLIVGYLAREHGFDKVIEMLRLYGEDLPQNEIFKRSFGMDTREFDARFLEYVRDEMIAKLRIVPRWDNRAVRRLGDRLDRNPKDVDTHLKLGWAMLQRGIGVDASDHLRQIYKLDPDNAEARLLHAHLLLQRKRFDEAAAKFEEGFDGGVDDFESRIQYGRLLESRDDTDGAARQYLAAKRCWPRCTDQNLAPPILLAKLYHKLDRRTEAMMELKMFCGLTARAFKPRLTLAEWEHEAGNFESEAKLLDEAIQIDPFARSVHTRLATALEELGRLGEAARELRVALSIDPSLDRDYMGAENPPTAESPEFRASQADVCVRLAKLLKRLSDDEKAFSYLDRARDEAPNSDAANEAEELRARWTK